MIENINLIQLTIIICLIFISIIISIFYKVGKLRKQSKKDPQIVYRKIMTIEELKEKFKYDLIGRWTSCEGTFINVMNEAWIFYPNGKGIIISNSVLPGEDKEEFSWRKKDLFCIEIAYTEFDEEEESPAWIEIRYDFCKVPTDVGLITALVQLDKDGNPGKGFGFREVPLSYVSDVE